MAEQFVEFDAVVVSTDPTTGGACAALAGGADIILAKPDATGVSAGRRVRGPVAADHADEVKHSAVRQAVPVIVDLQVEDAKPAPATARRPNGLLAGRHSETFGPGAAPRDAQCGHH